MNEGLLIFDNWPSQTTYRAVLNISSNLLTTVWKSSKIVSNQSDEHIAAELYYWNVEYKHVFRKLQIDL